AHIEFSHFAVFRIIPGDGKIFAGKSFHNAHTAQTFLHHSSQRPCFVLHTEPYWAQTTANLDRKQNQDWDADHRHQGQVPVESKEYNANRAKSYQCQQRAQQPHRDEVTHGLDINSETRHQLPSLRFVMKRETEDLQVIIELVAQVIGDE